MLLVFVGETGVGKTSLMRLLSDTRRFFYARNVTTRHARFGEHHKTTVSGREFEQLEAKGELRLVNSHFSNKYGYLSVDIDHAISSRSIVYMIEIDIKNLNQVASLPNTARIVVVPETDQMLRDNIIKAGRGRDPDQAIARLHENFGHLTEGYNSTLDAFVVKNVLNELGTTAFKISDWLSRSQEESGAPKGSIEKAERLAYILENIRTMPPASSGLEAYKYLSDAIDRFEDRFGPSEWEPPRTFLDGSRSERMYTIFPESFFRVREFSGVTMLLSRKELIFISRYGAVQVQRKDFDDPYGEKVHFKDRFDNLLFDKPDVRGIGVWDASNY